jgi:hypothetical protein
MKVLYDLRGQADLATETAIQRKAAALLKDIPGLHVPHVYGLHSSRLEYRDNQYLCGIEMDRVPIPEGFQHQVHMLLGYAQDDIDSVWSKDYRNDVGPANPARGFFAGPEMLEAIWEDEGSTMTIDRVAAIMGETFAKLIAGGIIPLDLEWLYAGDGQIWLIDFGLCELGHTDPHRFLHVPSSRGIHADYYAPKPGMRGYEAFVNAFTAAAAQPRT